MRAEEARLAFQRFWRRSADRPGSGLGLAIVRATAERHGGRAYAEGSRFTIEMPALRNSFKLASYNEREELEERIVREAPPHPLDRPTRRRCSSSSSRSLRPAARLSPSPPSAAADRRRLRSRSRNAIHDALAGTAPEGHHGRDHLHEQPLPVGRAHRRSRLGAAVRRKRPALGHERRPRPARAAVERGRRADRLERATGHRVRRLVEHGLQVHAARDDVASTPGTRTTGTPPALAEITSFLAELSQQATVSGAQPDNVGSQPAYTRHRLAEARRRPARLGAARVRRGTRRAAAHRDLRAGQLAPALALEATNVSYGAVDRRSDVDIAPPAGAKVVDLSSLLRSDARPARHGSRSEAGRPVSPPCRRRSTSRSRPRHARRPPAQARRARRQGRRARRLRPGLGAIVVVERKADARAAERRARRPADESRSTASRRTSSRRSSAPSSSGSRAGRAFVLAGSLPPAAAESAARELEVTDAAARRRARTRQALRRHRRRRRGRPHGRARRRLRLSRPERRGQDDVAADAARADPPDGRQRRALRPRPDSSRARRRSTASPASSRARASIRISPVAATCGCSPTTTSRTRARGSRRCSSWSSCATARRTASAATRTACGSGSGSRRRCSASRGCSCSTSRRPVSTRRACATCATSSARLAGEGITILLSSHLLYEVEELCNRVAIIRTGLDRLRGNAGRSSRDGGERVPAEDARSRAGAARSASTRRGIENVVLRRRRALLLRRRGCRRGALGRARRRRASRSRSSSPRPRASRISSSA